MRSPCTNHISVNDAIASNLVPAKAFRRECDLTRDSSPDQLDLKLIGESGLMRKLKEAIRLIARSNETVLITGESGTGKELIARALHELSRRRSKPFVAVNCGALTESLLESELFGHVKGAHWGSNE